MKNSSKQIKYHFNNVHNNRAFMSSLRRFYWIKGNFIFDIFQYLKMENEKLQIIYANIRV
ncbi:hypothetical protein FUMI01_10440 [Flavobacterium sp. UMI-01]|nr:hypothetical protein FUMI01_10440 [Flavobacterium sp. UMI-01]